MSILAAIEPAEWGLYAHLLTMIIATIRILSVQRNTGVAIAWLTIMFAVPLLGVVAYILVGEPTIGRRYQQRTQHAMALLNDMSQREQLLFDRGHEQLSERYQGVSRIGTRWTGFGVYDGQQMQLLTSADAVFDSLIADIDAARQMILIEFYIIYPKGRVLEVLAALAAAARRGVECHILADSVGSLSFFASEAERSLAQAGVLVHRSLPVGLFKTLFKRTDLRNHRKIVVIDEQVGYTGSFNLVDPRFFKQDKNVGQWVDVMMRIQSLDAVCVVTAMAKVVVADIGAESYGNLDVLHERINTYTRKLYVRQPAINDINDTAQVLDEQKPLVATTPEGHANLPVVGNVLAQLIPSAPQVTAHVIYNTLVTVIHRANKYVQITTPYFVPDEALLSALTTAAKRGVEVTLIVPERVDSFLVQHASQASYQELLEMGVRIALFKGGLLHTKTVMVDEDYCLFGTVNMDMRSFYLNMEVSLAIYTPELVAQIVAIQKGYLQHCELLSLAQWQQRPSYQRVFDNGVRLFSPLL